MPPDAHATETVAPRPGPSLRADYRTFLPITTRWMDNDVFGHVNNVHYYSFFDTAVCTFLVRSGILGQPAPTHIMMIAESGCRYHAETAFPEPLQAGIRILRLGASSVRYAIAIFKDSNDTAAADGFLVHVCVDAQTRRPAPLPPAWRSILAKILTK